ncbi:MAG TPA: hypothetical protein VJV78_07990 [Polyangiales bacterium]|nr:hypothetical protein [Polyangiales bacterium]
MRVRVWVVVVAALAAAVAASLPARSHACSCAAGGLTTNPADSANDVPRNQAIVLNGWFEPDTIALVNLDGRPHAFELRAWQAQGPCGGSFTAEVIPTPVLDADTHYELRVMPRPSVGNPGLVSGPTVIRFSTGAELLPDPVMARPSGRLALVKPPSNVSTSCGPFAATGCLTVDEPTDDLELVLRDGDEIFSVLKPGEAYTPLTLFKMPTCIDLQRHAPTGRRSPPLTFCDDDLKLLSRSPAECSADFFGGVRTDEADPEQPTLPQAAGASGGTPASASHGSTADSEPMATDSSAVHQEYGCTALAPRNPPRSGLTAMLLIALVAVSRLRRKR